ncbi:SpoIIE family protein phosphatase [Streptomyces sp. NPDC096176]|uniref:SpoIIE family protein phosphatase n=1 Tax=Streptomyces sp. NPDC096176 TaxID=3366079 RepID=UPI00380E547A
MSSPNTAASADFRGPLNVTRAAIAVLDAQNTVVGWSSDAETLLGWTPREIIGCPLDTFLSLPATAESGGTSAAGTDGTRRSDARLAVHRDGHRIQVATATCPLAGPGTGAQVIAVAELRVMRQWESRLAMLQGLATQSPIGLAIYGTDLRLTWSNSAYEREIGRPLEEYLGKRADELYATGRFVTKGYPETLDAVMHHVLDTGEPFLDLHFRGEQPSDPGKDHLWSCSYYRLTDEDGNVLGICEDAFDITDRYEAQRRLDLLVKAGRSVGGALDVVRTAEQIAEVAVPDFADSATVDLVEAVLDGELPAAGGAPKASLVRIASRPAATEDRGGSGRARWAGGPVAVVHPPGTPQHRVLSSGGLVLDGDTLVVPLRAGGSLFGLITFVRADRAVAFDNGEVALADELAARAAVSIDNARRFTRERTSALTLQQQLLPRHVPRLSAVDVAHRYLPTDDVTGVGGDWFDVVPLSGTRVGLVVGDVVGHGLHAAATMGRLRTTFSALAQLDLAPDELLKRLDDLVGQSGEDVEPSDGAPEAALSRYDVATGATCLYAVYDPVSRRCVMARAGHLPPVMVDPDGRVGHIELPAGPPLGLGGLPFESAEFELPVGSLLALFTDGLVESRDHDIEQGIRRLGRVLSDRTASLEDLCDRAVADLRARGATADDTALLLVRTRELEAGQIAEWAFPAEPATVGRARELAAQQVAEWGFEELSFSVQLIVSELVTNVIKHAGGPLRLRLIRDRRLLCEVADTGHTSPHLRHSAADDEGGRGLFIVAQLVHRWGTRYTESGKTIWTEQPLPSND